MAQTSKNKTWAETADHVETETEQKLGGDHGQMTISWDSMDESQVPKQHKQPGPRCVAA